MSLWQGTKWSHRQAASPPSSSPLHGHGHGPRLSFGGSSPATASQISLLSASTSGASTPRRPLNALGLRQDGTRSSSQPPPKLSEVTKPDHDAVKTLLGILGETEPVKEEADNTFTVETAQNADAGGKTLADWLGDLEKEEANKLSTEIDHRKAFAR